MLLARDHASRPKTCIGVPLIPGNCIEDTLAGWHAVGSPDITTVQLRILREQHEYWIDCGGRLRWEPAL